VRGLAPGHRDTGADLRGFAGGGGVPGGVRGGGAGAAAGEHPHRGPGPEVDHCPGAEFAPDVHGGGGAGGAAGDEDGGVGQQHSRTSEQWHGDAWVVRMISYVLPTRDRPERLKATLHALAALGDHREAGGAEVYLRPTL